MLDLAERLAQDASAAEISESYQRTTLNRAYFGVFNPAKRYLKDSGRGRRKGHKDVRNAFKASPNADEKLVGRHLAILHTCRCQADYKDEVPDLVAAVANSIAQARKTLALLAKLSSQ
ncbi:MAG: hypothetical protein AB7T14_06960 [Candidatus Methylacidiphilaceae bacterium]